MLDDDPIAYQTGHEAGIHDAPVAHVADTKANDPYGRARAVRHWTLTNDPRVAQRYGATWAIRAGRLYPLK